MDVQLLEHLTIQRDTLRYDARHCGYDMAYADMLYREALHFEARIEALWRDYEGAGAWGVVPARARCNREGSERRQL